MRKYCSGKIYPYVLIAGLELIGAEKVFAKEQHTENLLPPKIASQVEKIGSQVEKIGSDISNLVKITEDGIIINEDILLIHNIEKPESLTDLFKMLIEPVTIAINITVDKETMEKWPVTLIIDPKERTITADFPYEYAKDFHNASPKDQEKMKEEMRAKATELIEKVTSLVYGPSFFKDRAKDVSDRAQKIEVVGDTGEILQEERPRSSVDLEVTGYASPESREGINLDSPENKELSKLRADNAAKILKELLTEAGIDVESVETKAGGEILLNEEEMSDLSKYGEIMELIEQYNDEKITDQELKNKLDKYVAEKRKVSVEVGINDQKVIFVLPVPLLLAALPALRKVYRDYYQLLGKKDNAVFSRFIVPQIERGEGKINLSKTEKRQAKIKGKNDIGYVPFTRGRVRGGDVVKGYSASTNLDREYRDQYLKGAPHKNKKISRERYELEFDPNLPLDTRVGALACLLYRQLRMAPILLSKGRNINYDLLNFCPDIEALSALIEKITDKRFNIIQGSQVMLEVVSPARFKKENRKSPRQGKYQFRFWPDETGCIAFKDEHIQKLRDLAKEYIATHKKVPFD